MNACTSPDSKPLLRAPFHIRADSAEICLQLAEQHNLFFTLCRLRAVHSDEQSLRRSMLLYKDAGGWYVFGRPYMFPLTSAEFPTAPFTPSGRTEVCEDDFGQSWHCIPLPPIPPLLAAVAAFAAPASAKSEQVTEGLQSFMQSGSEHHYISRQRLLADIAQEILQQKEDPYKTLHSIPHLVKNLLNADISSLFLCESVLPRLHGPRQDDTVEFLVLDAAEGYDEKRLHKRTHRLEHLNRLSNQDSEAAGITASIVLDKKLVLLNHKCEVGGYDPSNQRQVDERGEEVTRLMKEQDAIRGKRAWAAARRAIQAHIKEKVGGEDTKRWPRDAWWRGELDQGLPVPCKRMVGVPIVRGDQVLGCLKAENPAVRQEAYEGDRFTFQDLTLLHCVSRLVAVAIQAIEDTEALTYEPRLGDIQRPVYSARYLAYHPIKTGWKDSMIVYVDVDNFKAINDRYGHYAGDEAMRQIAARIHDAARRSTGWRDSILGRVGGDEFVLLGPAPAGPVKDLARELNENIRADLQRAFKIREREHDVEHDVAPVTVSLGLAEFRLDSARPQGERLDEYHRLFDIAMEQADTAAKIAKWSGKNSLVLYSDMERLLRRSAVDEQAGDKREPILVIRCLGADKVIINAGSDEGVFAGLRFQVRYPTTIKDTNEAVDLEKKFKMSKAQLAVVATYPQISVCRVFDKVEDVAKLDQVELLR